MRAEIRAGALARLAELGTEEDFHLFLKATRDPSALVRRSAVAGLGNSGDSKAIDTLGEMLADADYDVQAEAAKGLARFNTDKARAYLLSAYGRRDGPARYAIFEALGSAGLAEAIRYEAKLLWDRHLKALEVGGPAERVGAAEEIGRSGRGEAVERLLPILGDDSVLLAAGAARGLGAAHDRRAVPSLVGVLKEAFPVLREAAADALGVLGDAAAVPALEKVALEGGSGAASSVNAIGQLSFSAEGRASLCKLAAEANREVASHAARLARERQGCALEPILARLSRGGAEAMAALGALEALGAGAAADRVAALLDSPDRAIKLAAARTLAAVGGGSEAAGARVVKLLEAESQRLAFATQRWIAEKLPEPAPRPPGAEEPTLFAERGRKFNEMMAKVQALDEARAQALGIKLVDREALHGPPDLADDLYDTDDELLLLLSRAAGRLKASGAQPTLLRLADDRRPTVRAAACEGLGAMGTEAALERVARCLEDPGRPVLPATARGLAQAGPGGVPLLRQGLSRPGAERYALIRALGELGVREAAPQIAELLSVGGAESVEAAVALGRLGDPAVAPALAAQLKDHTHPARVDVIQALSGLGNAEAAPALQRELLNERPEVRAAAARALGRLDRARSGPMLEALRFDYYYEVRRAVEESLGSAREAQGAR